MNEDLLSETPLSVDPQKDYLTDLVGDGKKFKTPADLARGKYEADLHIANLERTKDQLRADYLKLQEEATASKKLSEYIDQIKALQQQPTSSNTPLANVDNTKPAYDPKELESLVDTRMEAREASKKQSENFRLVQDRLKERFGNNFQTVLKQQIDELQLTPDYVNDLARRSPEAFFRTMGLKDQEQTQESFFTPPRSNQRSDGFHQKGSTKRTWSYYQELKKSNPTLYLDPKTVSQMTKDYAELGSSFEDGDFRAYGDGNNLRR